MDKDERLEQWIREQKAFLEFMLSEDDPNDNSSQD